ncbi:hypothetical protein IWX49DRAFT_594787 [Phyllosticta citricarpa]
MAPTSSGTPTSDLSTKSGFHGHDTRDLASGQGRPLSAILDRPPFTAGMSRPLPELLHSPVLPNGAGTRNAEKHRPVPPVRRPADPKEQQVAQPSKQSRPKRVAPRRDADDNIPEDVAYNRFPRSINFRAPEKGGDDFSEAGTSVIVFRVLTRDSIEIFIERSQKIRSVVAIEPVKDDEPPTVPTS